MQNIVKHGGFEYRYSNLATAVRSAYFHKAGGPVELTHDGLKVPGHAIAPMFTAVDYAGHHPHEKLAGHNARASAAALEAWQMASLPHAKHSAVLTN